MEQNLLYALELTGQGMGGIFVGMALIAIVTAILGKLTSKKK